MYCFLSNRVIQKQAKVEFKASHNPPALINEMYPIELKITRNEPEEVRVTVNAEIMAVDSQGMSTIIYSKLQLTVYDTNPFFLERHSF